MTLKEYYVSIITRLVIVYILVYIIGCVTVLGTALLYVMMSPIEYWKITTKQEHIKFFFSMMDLPNFTVSIYIIGEIWKILVYFGGDKKEREIYKQEQLNNYQKWLDAKAEAKRKKKQYKGKDLFYNPKTQEWEPLNSDGKFDEPPKMTEHNEDKPKKMTEEEREKYLKDILK